MLILALGERRELLHGVPRYLEVVLLGVHLQVLGWALDERRFEPFLAVHVTACLPEVPQTGRKGIRYLMGAPRGSVHVRNGLVQADGVFLFYHEPVHRLREGCDRPSRDVPGRIRENLFQPIGGCRGQESAQHVQRPSLPDNTVVTGPNESVQEAQELCWLGTIKANPAHAKP